jgi:hypothetical protein
VVAGHVSDLAFRFAGTGDKRDALFERVQELHAEEAAMLYLLWA